MRQAVLGATFKRKDRANGNKRCVNREVLISVTSTEMRLFNSLESRHERLKTQR